MLLYNPSPVSLASQTCVVAEPGTDGKRLVLQQLTFGPSEPYERLAPPTLTTTPPTPELDFNPNLGPPTRSRRMSSSFSRISYGVHDDADHEEIKLALGGKHQEGIVGALFGKSVKEQIGSTWFWQVWVFDAWAWSEC
jgi:hypothetical protein